MRVTARTGFFVAINEAYEAKKEASRVAAEGRVAKQEAEKVTIESLMTIEDVPERWREAVRALLSAG